VTTQGYRPPSTQRQYDACVLGSQVGGAVAAALLARRGFRVLEVDHDGRGAGYLDGGYVLPWRPAIFPSPRLMPAAESALHELAATSQVARTLHPLGRGLNLFLDRHRLDLPAAAEPRAAELRREWPAEDSALEAMLRELDALFEDGSRLLAAAPQLPPTGLFARLALRRAVARSAAPGHAPFEGARAFESVAGHPLPAALHALIPFLSSLDGPPSPLAVSRLLGGVLHGFHVADGGEQALRDLFRRHGAPSVANHDETAALRGVVESVELSGSRIGGLRLAGSSDLHSARVVLLATGAAGFARLLPKGAPTRALAALNRLRPARRILTVNFVVHPAALPPPLGPAALVLLGGEPVLLECQPARVQDSASDGAKRGAHVLCAASAVPAEPWTREGVLAGVDRIRKTLLEAIPFFDRHLIHESVPTLVGAGDGEPFADGADPIYEPLEGAALGVCGLPLQGPFKNLFHASRDVLPGLGLEGEIYAGIEAAAHAAAALGEKDRPGR
jgi:phytoene dehydrogenase-like protein